MYAAAALALASSPSAAEWDAQDLEAICAGERLDFPLPPFDLMDLDGDRRITATEADACESLETVFERLDLDADLELTIEEYEAFPDVWRRRQRVFPDPD